MIVKLVGGITWRSDSHISLRHRAIHSAGYITTYEHLQHVLERDAGDTEEAGIDIEYISSYIAARKTAELTGVPATGFYGKAGTVAVYPIPRGIFSPINAVAVDRGEP